MDNAALDWAFECWVGYMRRGDFHEYRSIWFPAQSMVLEGRRSVNAETTDDDTEDRLASHVALCVDTAIKNLTPAQRGALERSLSMCAVCRVRDYETQVAEARQKIWLALLAHGCL